MAKSQAYDEELTRWQALFAATSPDAQKAAEGLIQRAAYLHSLCVELEGVIAAAGAIKVHPEHPNLQRQVPAVKEYARLSEAYANIVNKLNRLRVNEGGDGESDGLEEYDDDNDD